MAERGPLDRAADVLLYAPIGLLASVRSLLPELASRGRQELGGQVTVARTLGELAVRQGQRQAEEVLGRARHQAEAMIDTFLAQVADEDVLPEPAAAPPAADAPTLVDEPGPAPAAAAAPPAEPDEAAAVVPAVDDLAIPGYGSLAASQVVPRLAGLAPDELEAVRAYEAGTRRRRTILTRIAQLQAR
jgi:hypothetical protein